MGQASKKRLPSILNHIQENMRGYNSLFIIITSKDSKKSFKEAVFLFKKKYMQLYRVYLLYRLGRSGEA